jgi:hypothetical protein
MIRRGSSSPCVVSAVFLFGDFWIVGVNPLPRGASVEELGKNLTPSERRVCRNS